MEKKENCFKRFFGEFKKFITRGNVLDMAVGVIVGGAFTAIINALSNNILKPLIDWLLAAIMGGDSLSDIYTVLKPVYDSDGASRSLAVHLYRLGRVYQRHYQFPADRVCAVLYRQDDQ